MDFILDAELIMTLKLLIVDLPQQLHLELLTLPLRLLQKRLKTILFATDSTDLGRERL